MRHKKEKSGTAAASVRCCRRSEMGMTPMKSQACWMGIVNRDTDISGRRWGPILAAGHFLDHVASHSCEQHAQSLSRCEETLPGMKQRQMLTENCAPDLCYHMVWRAPLKTANAYLLHSLLRNLQHLNSEQRLIKLQLHVVEFMARQKSMGFCNCCTEQLQSCLVSKHGQGAHSTH